MKEEQKMVETIIEPTKNYFQIPWRELLHYRDLLFLFVRRDFISKYKQTVLGPLWFVLQPLLTTVVFTIVFGKMARIPTDGLPPGLFYLCGLLAWDYFSQCVNGTSTSLLSNAGLFSKVYFPRLIIPLSIILSNLMKYGLQFVMFLGFYFYFKFFTSSAQFIHPHLCLLLLPLVVLATAIASLGVGLWVSALTVKNRDLQHLTGFAVQLWMYGTPVIYPLGIVPENWKWLVLLNPMTEVVEFYRLAFFGTGTLTFGAVLVSCSMILFVFFSGLFLFNRAEKTFVDTI